MTTNIFITGLQELRRRAQEAMEAARLQYLQQLAVKKAADELLPPPAQSINEILQQRVPDIRSLLQNPQPIGRRNRQQQQSAFVPPPIIFTTSTVEADWLGLIQASFTINGPGEGQTLTIPMAQLPYIAFGGGSIVIVDEGDWDPAIVGSSNTRVSLEGGIFFSSAVTDMCIRTYYESANSLVTGCGFRYYKKWLGPPSDAQRLTWTRETIGIDTPAGVLKGLRQEFTYESFAFEQGDTGVTDSIVAARIVRTYVEGVPTYTVTAITPPAELLDLIEAGMQVITPRPSAPVAATYGEGSTLSQPIGYEETGSSPPYQLVFETTGSIEYIPYPDFVSINPTTGNYDPDVTEP